MGKVVGPDVAGAGAAPPAAKGGGAGFSPRNQAAQIDETRRLAIMKAARQSGLLGEKSARIGGRISPALLEQAKKQTGIETDTDLIEFALANLALEDDFGATFEAVHGTVDPDLKLGF